MKKTFDSEKIIHLFKGSKRYVTIIPYEEFKVMKKNFKNPKGSLPDEKAKSYEIRFSEDVVVQLLNIYSGDVEKIYLFSKNLDVLKAKPISKDSEKLTSGIYKTKIAELLVFYRISHKFKLITILSVEPFV
ncbi:hypothetical protein JGI14_102813 [Candidatus Kryptonium thompsonii]|uniref:Uncharacterized protein n=1 Tax=Candidatus Kryptonium thompsonii TaxID=1633631 RepID=A0A0P1M8E7_9BACT|nr:hypothetical protein [Candidatus Kryptonium thompsoni]CUS85156.1 hypothetical protein JGI13_01155 [Candidatus Kryptonium thompsoni]CUS85840.1 hypothetical protein JGI8_00934 [Candidatus Kryptonium thompsoni]CUS87525.1 hypothetical protein JGI14_102813 [Candidatus Kryptonium thompsoni]CUS91255.1 hypothetical protein JGI15_106512 [Candidatus Kryptonium thompsoni]CUS91575.1 hypothetical protein JGI6_00255 [Candidatus Kryptonium thompsoni]